jgi:hypothetical protein
MGIKNIIAGALAPVSEAYQARTERKKAEHLANVESDIKKLQANLGAINEGRKADENWELASIKNSGWKDELWSIVFAIVFICSFIPFLQEYAQTGIDQISGYPQWFQFLFSSIVLAAFGIRLWRRKGL